MKSIQNRRTNFCIIDLKKKKSWSGIFEKKKKNTFLPKSQDVKKMTYFYHKKWILSIFFSSETWKNL